jgi:hypothetical protein
MLTLDDYTLSELNMLQRDIGMAIAKKVEVWEKRRGEKK